MHEILLIGGGGHCKSVLQGMKRKNMPIAGIIDVSAKRGTSVLGVQIIGTDNDLQCFVKENYKALITVGSIKSNEKRKKLYDDVVKVGFEIGCFVSDRAIVSENVTIGKGSVVLDGVIINTGTTLGVNCIVNTGGIIEHDCKIGNHVHVAPGAVISGEVQIGDMAFIGVGAVLRQGVKIGNSAIIGAGAVISKNVPPNTTAVSSGTMRFLPVEK